MKYLVIAAVAFLAACSSSRDVTVVGNPVRINPPENLMTPARPLTPLLWQEPGPNPAKSESSKN